MSEKLPYEEIVQQQLTDLPLPDENLAWDEMRKLLEEDDDDAAIIPPIRRGCAGWFVLIGLILIGFTWYYFKPFKKNKKENTSSETVSDTLTNNSTRKNNTTTVIYDEPSLKKDSLSGNNISNTLTYNSAQELPDDGGDSLDLKQTISEFINKKGNRQHIEKASQSQKRNTTKYRTARTSYVPPSTSQPAEVASPANSSTIANSNAATNNNSNLPDSALTLTTDSIGKNKRDSVNVLKPIDSTIVQKNNIDSAKAKQKPEKTYSWGAGLALHYQIPIAGQSSVPYNSMGRTGSLADYVPSVFLRFYQDRHWFIESEFRYGAPQYTEEFVYDVKKHNSAQIDTLSKLKKTYYHQLPLSFNYYLFPGFSVGTGIVWNRFSSAVTEKEVVALSSTGGIDSTLSTEIVKITNTSDSVFSKSYWTWQLQTQYTWKRLMLGVRYSKGLQPYIKFTLPGGQSQQQSSQSFQIFLRYELWRSKKK